MIRQSTKSLNMDQTRVIIKTGDLEIFTDPLFDKVFLNLIENALRHEEKVTTIVFSPIKHDTTLSLIYKDDGAGINTKEKEMIFERGFGKNTGYGLFLIHHILAITRMSIVENGEPGMGARFEMSVPAGAYRNT